MERVLRDITMDYEMKEALRIARRAAQKRKQDRIFRQNAFIRQKIAGVVFCLVSIGIVWFLSQRYNQTEYAIFLPVLIFFGFYAILTDKLICEKGVADGEG